MYRSIDDPCDLVVAQELERAATPHCDHQLDLDEAIGSVEPAPRPGALGQIARVNAGVTERIALELDRPRGATEGGHAPLRGQAAVQHRVVRIRPAQR